MSVVPLAIPIMYALFLLVKFLKKYYPFAVTPMFFASLILFALLLPLLLNQIADWLVPTHWSDFAFWGALIEQASDSLREFLSAAPTLRDVELRMHLLRQTAITVFAICCGIFVCASNTQN
jgi:hypothetical protein